MKVTRDGDTFDVLELGDDWDFWGKRFLTDWEPETKAVIERFVDGGTFVDIGAWVGPVSLWAAARGADVFAVEADPQAFEHLAHNLSPYDGEAFNIAISDHDGVAQFGQRTGWNDSMSALVGVGETFDPIEVPCLTVETFFARCVTGDVQLVKMDIEGGEGLVIPQAEPFLRSLGAPLYLSLHPQWWPVNPLPILAAAGWKAERIAEHEGLFFP